MNHPPFRLIDGILGLSLESRSSLIDALLDAAREECPEEVAALLTDHRLLAAIAEFFARRHSRMRDERGFSFIPLKAGQRAYEFEEFANFICEEQPFLEYLKTAVRKVMFERFVHDAVAEAADAQNRRRGPR